MYYRARGYKDCDKQAEEFLNWLLQMRGALKVSTQAYTFSLMYLLKTNELAYNFTRNHGFKIFANALDDECTKDHQVAYNVASTLWILSYHQFTLKDFEDYSLNIIEKAVKVLDFFNKEKVVRIVLLLLDNLKTASDGCHEIMSDIGVLNLTIKLQNRHWVDNDITELLDKLFEFLDQNQKTFSSILKFRKEVSQKSHLRWGPIHTEKFWQENFLSFHEKDNLDLIRVLVDVVKNETAEDRDKAIACFDLGEFARYFPLGRQILDQLKLKEEVIKQMGRVNSSAELKKEAIICYQKMVFDSKSSTSIKF